MTTPNPHASAHNKVKVIAGYALQQRLGSGSFATVYKGVKVEDGDSSSSSQAQTVAIKAITRASEKLTKKVLENLEMEISILRTYQHPNIVCLQEVHRTERHFYLILEYCGGGDLQRLIRTRKSGRLTERLTRRLMRDLASGLRFLWGQELIHRDIKPQNLLLTGALPLDELNDPAKMDVHEDMRRQANFPSSQFALKIADFGFARHLQTATLADTLCGSPLYMAPEILQHHRYDAKADLWSVGTVLFEMIAGRPPFNGENHIDLLRNIQRKAVRLPADVRVSQECVKLLRILLNRNPLSRAGFKEFFEACDAFVALGCEGENRSEGKGVTKRPSLKMDLGTIPEVDASVAQAGTSAFPVEIQVMRSGQSPPVPNSRPPTTIPAVSPPLQAQQPGLVTPPLGPVPAPAPPSKLSAGRPQVTSNRFAPLQPSPPQTPTELLQPGLAPNVPQLSAQPSTPGQIQLANYNTSTFNASTLHPSVSSNQASQNSTDESGFVMVEHGTMNRSGSLSPGATSNHSSHRVMENPSQRRVTGRPLTGSPPTSPRYVRPTGQGGEYYVVNDSVHRHVPRGMLSTSPGTGLAFLGFMGRPRLLTPVNQGSMTPTQTEAQLSSTTNMIAVAEDIGRRAISVAHLGDARAYMAMKIVFGGSCGSSLFSTSPMEGVEEEKDDHSSANVSDTEDNSSSTEPTGQNRQRAISADRSMSNMNTDDGEEEMPFAFPIDEQKESSAMAIPSRSGSVQKRSSLTVGKAITKPNPDAVKVHFGEALSCYLKAMSMLKKVLGNVQKVRGEIDGWTVMIVEHRNRLEALAKRCEVTYNWLTGQFNGVLERAEAANMEITKLAAAKCTDTVPVSSVEELIYNHSLACGRDGAVKQLLGQYDAARLCYRSAGLLAETLLMEPNISKDDRKVLEGYVNSFAARIVELDQLMLQQSRSVGGSQGNSVQKKGSGVIGLIGGISPPNSSFSPPPFQLGM